MTRGLPKETSPPQIEMLCGSIERRDELGVVVMAAEAGAGEGQTCGACGITKWCSLSGDVIRTAEIRMA